MTAPQKLDKLDQRKVDGLVNVLAELRVKSYVRLGVQETGLEASNDRVVILGADGTRHTLLLGKTLEGGPGERYAKWEDNALVFVLSKATLDKLAPKPDALTPKAS